MTNNEKMKKVKSYLSTFAKWLLLSILIGSLCGAAGIAFHYALVKVTAWRLADKRLMLLLPLWGVIIVFFYHKFKMSKHRGTNDIFEAVRSAERVPLRLAPLIFIGTTLTHLAGGSAGREGAALQMGGSIGAAFARVARLNDQELRIAMVCGMAAVFSALFGTPLTATLFCIEVINVGVFQYAALVPVLGSSLIAYQLAGWCGIAPERFVLHHIPEVFLLTTAGRVLVLSILCGAVSIVLCEVLHNSGKIYKRFFPNPYLRVIVGALLVLFLTTLVGNFDYNGAGMELAAHAIEGKAVAPAAFLLKLLFTALTLGAGFRGGEIVPTLCIGATFGSAVGGLLGLDPGFAAALGMIAVFCGAVNCPIASLALSVEFFGSEGLLYFAIAVAVGYMLSGRYSLYAAQKLVYSKLAPIELPPEKDV